MLFPVKWMESFLLFICFPNLLYLFLNLLFFHFIFVLLTCLFLLLSCYWFNSFWDYWRWIWFILWEFNFFIVLRLDILRSLRRYVIKESGSKYDIFFSKFLYFFDDVLSFSKVLFLQTDNKNISPREFLLKYIFKVYSRNSKLWKIFLALFEYQCNGKEIVFYERSQVILNLFWREVL